MSVRDRSPLALVPTLLDAGQHARALAILAPYLASNPDDAFALCLMGRAMILTHDYAMALQCAERAVAIAPNDAMAWRVLSVAASGLGRNELGLTAATRAVELEPLAANGYHLVVESMQALGRNRRKAFALAEKAIELDPGDPAGYVVLGNLYLKRHRNRAAARWYRQALHLSPDHQVAAHNLGVVSLRQGRVGESVRLFGSVLRTRPRSRLASLNIRQAFIRLLLGYLLIGVFAHLTGIAVDLLIHGASEASVAPDLGDAPWWARLAVLTTTVGAITTVSMRFRRSLAGRTRLIVRSAITNDPLLAAWAGSVAGIYVMEILGCMTGPVWSQAFYMGAIAFFGITILTIYMQGFVNLLTPRGNRLD
jgi:tetratricopeptide (TPR) repeat protein